MRFEEYLSESARQHPDSKAIIEGDRRTSYAEFNAAADSFAASLIDRAQFANGERCVMFLDNSLEAAVGVFGTLRAGGIFSVINPTTKADKLAYVLGNCTASVLLTQSSLVSVAIAAAAQAPSIRMIIVVDGDDAHPAGTTTRYVDFVTRTTGQTKPVRSVGIDIDLAMLVYTSGSTGNPKGVMMTHKNIDHAATSVTTYLQSRQDDVVLSVLPFSFDYGLYQLLMCVKMGATLVVEKSFAFPQKVLPLLQSEKVTGFPIVPTIVALILQLRNFNPAWAQGVKYLTNTAAALPPAHIMRLQEIFPNARIYSMYGMTESKRCTYLPPEYLALKPDSVGIAIPGTEAWVEGDDGKPAAAGVVGELVVRGGHVMQGYWQNEEATAKALKPGRYPWEKVLHTGDLFRTDQEGFLYFVGRKDDILKSRGEKVSPKEVENVLYAMPGITEAALVGVPDPILGHLLRAIVVATDAQVDARAVIAHCRAHLEEFMIPREVEFRESLPKTSTGKIRRSVLQAEVEGRVMAGEEE